MEREGGFVPGRHAIEAYGAGAFRFAGLSHVGSILCLPSGVAAWAPKVSAEIDAACLDSVREEAPGSLDLMLIGTGDTLVPLPEALRWRLREVGVRCDPMATGAAVRTYNILLGEGRTVGCALLAVA